MARVRSVPRFAAKKGRHDPLHKQIQKSRFRPIRQGRNKKGTSSANSSSSDPVADKSGDILQESIVLHDKATSDRVLDLARAQQLEEAEELLAGASNKNAPPKTMNSKNLIKKKKLTSKDESVPLVSFSAALRECKQKSHPTTTTSHDHDFNHSDADTRDVERNQVDSVNETDLTGEGFLNVSEEDLRTLERFFPTKTKERKTLAQKISQMISTLQLPETNCDTPMDTETQPAAYNSKNKDKKIGNSQNASNVDFKNQKVQYAFTKIGDLLSRYRSGKLTKLLKILPTLTNWEQILWITRPDKWTPHAVCAMTRIMVSNLQPKEAQRYLNLVVLARVREDIAESRKLNYHFYMALKKSLYKPGAFFKGILLPLALDECSLREASIIGSVVSKVSVPVLHSSATLMRLAEMDYSGAVAIFIRILLDKKYSLPFLVIDALVKHFVRMRCDPRDLPVLWHQSLLVFVQRYKNDITPEQKETINELIKFHVHSEVTSEIRRELFAPMKPLEMTDVVMVDA